MSSTDENTCQLKAGHPPAVKAGGMRITQHKDGHNKPASKDIIGDVTGLSGPSIIPTNPVTIGGAPAKHATDYVLESAQAAHSPKPASNFAMKPQSNINQPRK